MRTILRFFFDTLAAFSCGVFMLGLVGTSMVIYFRVTHLNKTGNFEIVGPPETVSAYLAAEKLTILVTLGSTLMPLIWVSDRLRSNRADRKPATGHQCENCGHSPAPRQGRCPKCGKFAW